MNVRIFIEYGSRHKGYANEVHRDQNHRVQNHSTIEKSLQIGKEEKNPIAKKNVSVPWVNIQMHITKHLETLINLSSNRAIFESYSMRVCQNDYCKTLHYHAHFYSRN